MVREARATRYFCAADQADWWFIGGNNVRNTRFAVGSSVLTSAVVLAGLLPGLATNAGAVVAQDKLVLLTGTSASSDFGSVAVANADGTGVKTVRKGTKTHALGFLAIAPGNNRIAMEIEDSTKDSGSSTIAVMNVDGSGYRVLAHSKTTETVSQLRWNATGTKLLVSLENDDQATSHLATLDPNAAHPALVKLSGSVGLDGGSFSPLSDGTVVATDGGGSIVTLTGGHTTLVLSGGATGFADPVFSPDGGTIAFSAFALVGTAFVFRIEVISADGQVGPTVLVGSGENLWPIWSSDGKSVAYTSASQNGNSFKSYRVAADGGSPPALIPFPAGKFYLVLDEAAPDTTAPSAPTSLHVSLNGAHPVVSWKWPTDLDVSKVIVRRLAGTVAPATPTDGSPVYAGRALTITDAVSAGGTYTYAAWAVDGAGNTSGPSAGKTFLALHAPVLTTPPLVSSISVGMRFPVSWAPTTANPLATPYTVQWEVAGGTWATWQSGVTTTSATFGMGSAPVSPTAGKTYALRAFVTDPYGNTSVKTAAKFVELKDDRAATARGGWSSLHAKTSWLGTTRATTHAKASLSIGLTGSTLWLVGDRLPHGSRADVYVDGKKVATIDTHGSTAHRHILWSKRVKKGHHVVKVVNLATSGRAHLSLDGFASS